MPPNNRKRYHLKLDGDYISGWYFRVHKAFLDQLDIKLADKTAKKPNKGPKSKMSDEEFIKLLDYDRKPYKGKDSSGREVWRYKAWMAGREYYFDRGHMMHNSDETLTVQVQDDCEPATQEYAGVVNFNRYEGKKLVKFYSVTQAEFVEILKTGNFPE